VSAKFTRLLICSILVVVVVVAADARDTYKRRRDTHPCLPARAHDERTSIAMENLTVFTSRRHA